MIKQQLWADVYKHLLFKNGDAKQAVFEADEAVKDFEERWSNKCLDCGVKIDEDKRRCFDCSIEYNKKSIEAAKKSLLLTDERDHVPYTGNGDNISVKLDEKKPFEGYLNKIISEQEERFIGIKEDISRHAAARRKHRDDEGKIIHIKCTNCLTEIGTFSDKKIEYCPKCLSIL